MSILIKSQSGSGGSPKGYPTGDVNIINYYYYNGTAKFKWSDPDDIVYNNTTLSTWAGTILVRKTGSYPTSPTDGTVVVNSTTKNAYKNTYLEDTGLTSGNTYYYRFYTYNTDKVYNDSSSMTIKMTEVSATLADNSWETISTIAEDGVASSIWSIGDEIDIILSGTYNVTIPLQIWDFNHFDKSDSSGKAGITFGCKKLMIGTGTMNLFTSAESTFNWNNTSMKNTIMPDILSSMPSELQSIIKEVNTYANRGGGSSSSSVGLLSTDKVFIPGFTELFGSGLNATQTRTESNQTQFPIFTDDYSRMRLVKNSTSTYGGYWTRSPSYNYAYGFYYCYPDGTAETTGYTSNNYINFCFNI